MGMKSGELLADGSVGLYAACEMKNGLLTINGDAGDFLGAALPGNKFGITIINNNILAIFTRDIK
jgi:formylmethanofuran dehydrogenase subunit C